MTAEQSEQQTCFVSAPRSVDIRPLLRVLKRKRIRPIHATHRSVAEHLLVDSLQSLIKDCDLVVAVLGEPSESSWVFFELGLAQAMRKRTIIFAPTSAETLPFEGSNAVVVRTSPDNWTALEFALDQVVCAPKKRAKPRAKSKQTQPNLEPLGIKVEHFVRQLSQESTDSAIGLERLVGDVLRSAGTEVVSEARDKDQYADFAVWSDLLEPHVGNPLLIEVKQTLGLEAVPKFSRAVQDASAGWGLLIYRQDTTQMLSSEMQPPQNVLLIQVEDFINQLQAKTFVEVVKGLRNKSVHGLNG